MDTNVCFCGVVFELSIHNQKYCSVKCRQHNDYVEHREVRIAEVARYQQENREVTLRNKRAQWHELKKDPQRYAKYLAKRKAQHRRDVWKRIHKKYGLTEDKYREIEKKQNGLCAICKGPPTKHRGIVSEFVIDHSHSTGIVRGLLCSNCNVALGLMRDNPLTLREAAAYVEKITSNGNE